MKLRFANNQLRRCYEDERLANRRFGPQVGLRYLQRVRLIMSTASIDRLMEFRSLRLHPLKGDRYGLWVVDLVAQWRLLFSIEDDTVVIQEVSNHYD